MPELPERPLPNTYWVVPGRLLAGEYPGASDEARAVERIRRLIEAGLTQFIDLTEPDELAAYAELLPAAVDGRPVRHQRYAIPDHDVPDSPEVVVAALDAIDRGLADGGGIYLHCRAGIGRTALVAGCWLARQCGSGEEALERLVELWSQSERARLWRSIPETDAQAEFVRAWSETAGRAQRDTIAPGGLDRRYQGALLGLAMGDALGAIVDQAEPSRRFNGVWTGDTAMTLCVARSLLDRGGSDPRDQMNQLLRWSREGWLSATGAAIGLNAEVRRALAHFVWSRKPLAGSHDPTNRDPHPLPRVLAPVLGLRRNPALALDTAVESARLTLQSPLVLDACRYFAALLLAALDGVSRTDLLERQPQILAEQLDLTRLKPELRRLSRGGWRLPRDGAADRPDVLSVLSAALQALEETSDFRAGAQHATTATATPSTTGAVYGALAGICYGSVGLPRDWWAALARVSELEALAFELLARSEVAPGAR